MLHSKELLIINKYFRYSVKKNNFFVETQKFNIFFTQSKRKDPKWSLQLTLTQKIHIDFIRSSVILQCEASDLVTTQHKDYLIAKFEIFLKNLMKLQGMIVKRSIVAYRTILTRLSMNVQNNYIFFLYLQEKNKVDQKNCSKDWKVFRSYKYYRIFMKIKTPERIFNVVS